MRNVYHQLTFLGFTQPWRASPNKDINYPPDFTPLTSPRPYQTYRKAQWGNRKQQLNSEWLPQ